MLPRMWSQPACMNMAAKGVTRVRSLSQKAARSRGWTSGFMPSESVIQAGTAPQSWNHRSSSDDRSLGTSGSRVSTVPSVSS